MEIGKDHRKFLSKIRKNLLSFETCRRLAAEFDLYIYNAKAIVIEYIQEKERKAKKRRGKCSSPKKITSESPAS